MSAAPARVAAVGVGEASLQRLAAGNFDVADVTDDPAAIADGDVVVVSTRLPRPQLAAALGALGDRSGPLVALAHTGGEAAAVEILRAGGVGVLAEGNEAALGGHVPGHGSGAPGGGGLVEIFERRLAQSRRRGGPAGDRDAVTGLAGRSVFDERLAELREAGGLPRIVFLRLLHLTRPGAGRPDPAGDLVRRRLGLQFAAVARRHGSDCYSVGAGDFAVVGADLTVEGVTQMAAQMGRMASLYAPDRQQPVTLAVGHAGPEAASEQADLRELALRALELAATEQTGGLVAAAGLSVGASATTELEAALRAVADVEARDVLPPGHGERAADLAADVATQLGYDATARSRVQLAALLHDIGKIAIPGAAIAGAGDLDGELLDAYRSHPRRGADYLRVCAGEDVAEAVASQHEHWDGSGFPEGLAGQAIPLGGRIVALAHCWDELACGREGAPPPGPGALAEGLRALAGTRLDPSLVDVAAELLSADPPAAGRD